MYLSVIYQNVRRLRSKTNEFKLNLANSEADLIFLTETWLNDSVINAELFDGS